MQADFPRRQFSERFYCRLASTFGYVGHWRDFFQEFFTTTQGKVRFLRQTLHHLCRSDPALTFSDVGRALQAWLMQSSVLVKYEQPLTGGTPSLEPVPAAEVQHNANQTLLAEFRAAYRSQNLRPVRGFYLVRGKRIDLACPLVALALHRAVVNRSDPELSRDDTANPALAWAVLTFGESWSIGVLDGFDYQEKVMADLDYGKGHDLGSALAQEILPGERCY